jgi:molecular chaperone Hsp33
MQSLRAAGSSAALVIFSEASKAVPDELLTAMWTGFDLKVVVAVATAASRRARDQHRMRPASAAMLAQGMCGAALVAALAKDFARVNLQIECDGPLRGLFVDADSGGNVRGYAKNALVEFRGAEGPFRWRPALGNSGFLSMLRDRTEGDFYRSSIELSHFDLALDLEGFFDASEQVATALALELVSRPGEELGAVAGILVQALPSGDREKLADLKTRLHAGRALFEALRSFAPEADITAAAIATALFDREIEVFTRTPLEYRCDCSTERVERALTTLSAEELTEIMVKEGHAEATCQFCGMRYEVGPERLKVLIAEKQANSR